MLAPVVPTTRWISEVSGRGISGISSSCRISQRCFMSSSVPSALISRRKVFTFSSRFGIFVTGEKATPLMLFSPSDSSRMRTFFTPLCTAVSMDSLLNT